MKLTKPASNNSKRIEGLYTLFSFFFNLRELCNAYYEDKFFSYCKGDFIMKKNVIVGLVLAIPFDFLLREFYNVYYEDKFFNYCKFVKEILL